MAQRWTRRALLGAAGATALGGAIVAHRRRSATEDTPLDPELTRMVGGLLLVGFDGSTPDHAGVERTRAQIASGAIGGLMYLRRNVSDEAGVRALNAAFRDAADPTLPPIVALDQEGGRVARLRHWSGFTPVPSARHVAAQLSAEEARSLYARMGRDLARWGFNMNLGPVVDLDVHPTNPIIGRLGRSYSPDPARVAAYGRAFVRGHASAGVATALKHFPGHGSSRTDSHLGLADVTHTWTEAELRPYAELIASGDARVVMTGHLTHRGLSSRHPDMPATLSREVIEDLLRRRLGFTGVVISDDLQMDAVAARMDAEAVGEAALRAGVDVLLYANDGVVDPTLVPRVTSHVVRAAMEDPTLRRRIEASHERVIALRRSLVPRAATPLAKPLTGVGS